MSPPAAFDPDRIVSPMLRRLHDLWRERAGDRTMPRPRDLDPAGLPWAAEFLTIHDALPDGDFRFRVDAPHTANIFGSDMTGRLVSEYPAAKVRDLIARTLERVAGRRAPVLEMRDVTVSLWRWEYEILLLPLSDGGSRVDTVYSLPQIGAEIRR